MGDRISLQTQKTFQCIKSNVASLTGAHHLCPTAHTQKYCPTEHIPQHPEYLSGSENEVR